MGLSMSKPFLLKPAAKEYLWGGRRLNEIYNTDIDTFAEAWVCSSHPDGESTTESGMSLGEVLRMHPEWLGTHSLSTTEGRAELPILIKLIDAKEPLSVQVHPNDEYAKRNENGSWGKSEMWYVLSARPGAELIYGFTRDVDSDTVRSAINNGTIGNLLNHVPVHKDDLFYVEAGMVHAIGAGCMIAEIQQNSNVTYRLFDYDRTDKTGKKRDLHIDKGLEAAKLSLSETPRQPMRVLRYTRGCASELLMRCMYFQVERLLLNTERRSLTEFRTGDNSFHALLCIDGCGSIFSDNFSLNFFKGDCIFVPANSEGLNFHGKAQLLNVSC